MWKPFFGNPLDTEVDIVRVRLSNLDEVYAKYYKDKAKWIEAYGKRPCYFWHWKTHEPLYTVTHWLDEGTK